MNTCTTVSTTRLPQVANSPRIFTAPHWTVSTMHIGAMPVGFADGSVHNVSQAIAQSRDSATGNSFWYEYCTPDGEEIPPPLD
jgi:hypothetical protein